MTPCSDALVALAAGLFSIAPGASSSPNATGEVEVFDRTAFVIRAPRGEISAAQRAKQASERLESVLEEQVEGELSVNLHGDEATFWLGDRILFSLTPADAEAEGERSLERFAEQRKEVLESFLRAERRRATLKHGVLNLGLLVFLGFLSWLLMKQVRCWAAKLRVWVESTDPDSVGFLSKVLGDEKLRGLAVILLHGAQFFAYAAIAYLFLVGSLSLFDAGRPLREQLTRWAAEPFLSLAERVSAGVPTLLLLFLLGVVMQAGWHAINLTSERVASGRAHLGAVRPEFVPSVRLLLRLGLILASLLLLVALLTGPSGELFAVAGVVVLAGLGLALLPLAANMALGIETTLNRRFRLGDLVRLPDGRQGRLVGLELLHLRLLEPNGTEVLVPHLLGLRQPLRRLPADGGLEAELRVSAALFPAQVRERLETTARRFAERHTAGEPRVELVEVGAYECRYCVTIPAAAPELHGELLFALWSGLSEARGSESERSGGDVAAV